MLRTTYNDKGEEVTEVVYEGEPSAEAAPPATQVHSHWPLIPEPHSRRSTFRLTTHARHQAFLACLSGRPRLPLPSCHAVGSQGGRLRQDAQVPQEREEEAAEPAGAAAEPAAAETATRASSQSQGSATAAPRKKPAAAAAEPAAKAGAKKAGAKVLPGQRGIRAFFAKK